jgi:hypothetical protein
MARITAKTPSDKMINALAAIDDRLQNLYGERMNRQAKTL